MLHEAVAWREQAGGVTDRKEPCGSESEQEPWLGFGKSTFLLLQLLHRFCLTWGSVTCAPSWTASPVGVPWEGLGDAPPSPKPLLCLASENTCYLSTSLFPCANVSSHLNHSAAAQHVTAAKCSFLDFTRVLVLQVWVEPLNLPCQ